MVIAQQTHIARNHRASRCLLLQSARGVLGEGQLDGPRPSPSLQEAEGCKPCCR